MVRLEELYGYAKESGATLFMVHVDVTSDLPNCNKIL